MENVVKEEVLASAQKYQCHGSCIPGDYKTNEVSRVAQTNSNAKSRVILARDYFMKCGQNLLRL